MTEQEFKAQMEKIYAYNRRQKSEQKELFTLREIFQKLRKLVPPPGKILTVKELRELMKQIMDILEEVNRNG